MRSLIRVLAAKANLDSGEELDHIVLGTSLVVHRRVGPDSKDRVVAPERHRDRRRLVFVAQ